MVHANPTADPSAAAIAALVALERASQALRAVLVGLGRGKPAARERPSPARPSTTAPRPAPSVPLARALRELVVAVRVSDPQENRSDDAIAAEARDFLRDRGGATAENVRSLRDQVLGAWKGAGSAHLTRATLIERIEDAATSPASLQAFRDLASSARRAKVANPSLAVLRHVHAAPNLHLGRPRDRKALAASKVDWKRHR